MASRAKIFWGRNTSDQERLRARAAAKLRRYQDEEEAMSADVLDEADLEADCIVRDEQIFAEEIRHRREAEA